MQLRHISPVHTVLPDGTDLGIFQKQKSQPEIYSLLQVSDRDHMHDSGEQSVLLLQLIFVPLGVVLVIGLFLWMCRRQGWCCWSKADPTIKKEESGSPAKQTAQSTAYGSPSSSTTTSNGSVCAKRKSVKSKTKKKKKSSKKKKKKDGAAGLTGAAGAAQTISAQGGSTYVASPAGAVFTGAAAGVPARLVEQNIAQHLSASAEVGRVPERQNTPATADSAFTNTNLVASSANKMRETSALGSPAIVASLESQIVEHLLSVSPPSLESGVIVDITPDFDEIFLEDNIDLNSPHFPIPIQQLKIFVLNLYREFDADNDGHIDHFELKSFFRAVESRGRMSNNNPLTDQEISEILDAFDDDRNGTLERSEFCTWILSGLSKSPEERQAFANSKPLAQKLNNFLDGVVGYVERFSKQNADSSQFLTLNSSPSSGGMTGASSSSSSSSNGNGNGGATLFAGNSSPDSEDEQGQRSQPFLKATNRTLLGHKHWVETVSVSASGDFLFSGGVDAKIRMWNASTGKCVKRLSSHKNVITSLVCPSDNLFSGYHLCSGSVDKSIRLWDVEQGKCVGKLKGHHRGVTSVCVSPTNPNVICSGSTDASAAIWDARANKRVRQLLGHKESVDACSISADGELLCSASEDGSIRVWEIATGQCVNVLRDYENAGWIYSCDFSPTDRGMLCVGTHQHVVELWNVAGAAGGQLLQTFKGHKDAVMSVNFSKAGTRIVSGGMDNDLRLWDVASGKNVGRFQGHANMVSSVKFMPNGEQVVSGSRDHTVKIWSTQQESGGL